MKMSKLSQTPGASVAKIDRQVNQREFLAVPLVDLPTFGYRPEEAVDADRVATNESSWASRWVNTKLITVVELQQKLESQLVDRCGCDRSPL